MELKWQEEVKSLTLQEQWRKLYERNKLARPVWKAIWGGGAIPEQERLYDIFEEFDIKSFLDCGCADFHWLSKLDWTGIDYMGVDIVPELIRQNKRRFPDFKFKIENLVKMTMPKKDMVFIRDVFSHLNFKNCLEIIKNIKASGSRYLMASTQTAIKENIDTSCIVLQFRNLMIEPFNFPEPIKFISDKASDQNHVVGIWEIDGL